MKKRTIVTIFLATFSMTLLMGCGSGSSQNLKEKTSEGKTESVDQKKLTDEDFWKDYYQKTYAADALKTLKFSIPYINLQEDSYVQPAIDVAAVPQGVIGYCLVDLDHDGSKEMIVAKQSFDPWLTKPQYTSCVMSPDGKNVLHLIVNSRDGENVRSAETTFNAISDHYSNDELYGGETIDDHLYFKDMGDHTLIGFFTNASVSALGDGANLSVEACSWDQGKLTPVVSTASDEWIDTGISDMTEQVNKICEAAQNAGLTKAPSVWKDILTDGEGTMTWQDGEDVQEWVTISGTSNILGDGNSVNDDRMNMLSQAWSGNYAEGQKIGDLAVDVTISLKMIKS